MTSIISLRGEKITQYTTLVWEGSECPVCSPSLLDARLPAASLRDGRSVIRRSLWSSQFSSQRTRRRKQKESVYSLIPFPVDRRRRQKHKKTTTTTTTARNPFLALRARTRPTTRFGFGAFHDENNIWRQILFWSAARSSVYLATTGHARAPPPPLFISVRVRRVACDTHGRQSSRRRSRHSSAARCPVAAAVSNP